MKLLPIILLAAGLGAASLQAAGEGVPAAADSVAENVTLSIVVASGGG